ncbi:MAG: hypothetical protein HYS22_08390 [Deltaproteobacteria bacterium]|nr:hypothetical protein [Deltaproteobacteria bacterium]
MSETGKTTSAATQGLDKLVNQILPKNAEGPISGATGPSGKDVLLFSQVLEQNQKMSTELVQSMGLGQENMPTIKSVEATEVQLDPSQIQPDQQIQSNGKVGDILAEVNRGQLQMEGIMEIAMSGRRFSPSELLAMQAGVYQIAQEMELTSKVFEQVNTAHKTLWNTNFQG